MNEAEVHLKLSEVKINNDNLDYIKMTSEICGQLRYDLVKTFSVEIMNVKEIKIILSTLWEIRNNDKFYFNSYGDEMIKQFAESYHQQQRRKDLIEFCEENSHRSNAYNEKKIDEFLKTKS